MTIQATDINFSGIREQEILSYDELISLKRQNFSPLEHPEYFACKKINFFNSGVTDEKIYELMQVNNYITNITHISLEGCNKLTDWSIGFITSVCPHLVSISLQDCENVTDLSVQIIAQNCRSLENLVLSGNRGLTIETVQLLDNTYIQTKSNLKKVSFWDCPKIDFGQIKIFNQRLERTK